MTFRRGFVSVGDAMLFGEVQDRNGAPPASDVGSPMGLTSPGDLIEVDDAYSHKYFSRVRIPLPGHAGLYIVDNIFTSTFKDFRAEYAALRIAEIERVEGLGALAKAALGWAERGVALWWSSNPPTGLAVEERARVTAADQESITVRSDAGKAVVIPIGEFSLDGLEFERTSEEVHERAEKLERNKSLPVMTYKEALGYLANVPQLAAAVAGAGAATITVAKDHASFEEGCAAYLMESPQFGNRESHARRQAQLVNGYADRVDGDPAIFLRPGTQGSGIEVHESVHTLCSPAFEAKTTFFLSEGITEYFTRLATGTTFDRSAFYDTECFFVTELVKLGASTPEILAELYLHGDWEGFHDGLRAGFGDLVAIDVLLDRAADERAYSVLKYLRELTQDREAPLRSLRK